MFIFPLKVLQEETEWTTSYQDVLAYLKAGYCETVLNLRWPNHINQTITTELQTFNYVIVNFKFPGNIIFNSYHFE